MWQNVGASRWLALGVPAGRPYKTIVLILNAPFNGRKAIAAWPRAR
jgi:hypothetical protein